MRNRAKQYYQASLKMYEHCRAHGGQQAFNTKPDLAQSRLAKELQGISGVYGESASLPFAMTSAVLYRESVGTCTSNTFGCCDAAGSRLTAGFKVDKGGCGNGGEQIKEYKTLDFPGKDFQDLKITYNHAIKEVWPAGVRTPPQNRWRIRFWRVSEGEVRGPSARCARVGWCLRRGSMECQ